MSDGGTPRPRRAISPAEDDQDDTPTVVMYEPRRGQDWKPDAETVPRTAESEAAIARAKKTFADASSETATTEPEPDEDGAKTSKSRFKLAFAVVAILASLTLIAGGAWAIFFPAPAPSASPAAPTSAPSLTLTAADMWSPDDLKGLGSKGPWRVVQTLPKVSATSPQVACLTAVTGTIKPTQTLQRTLVTETADDTAALHQVDLYAHEADATKVFEQRAQKMASCDDLPAYIAAASSVTGIGDAAIQMTIAYQAQKTDFHTVLIVRTGMTISMFDVSHRDQALNTDEVVKAAGAVLKRSCEKLGTCPSNIAVGAGVPPKADPAGWLIEADWPRLSPDTGRWTATEVIPAKSPGTNCENLSLTSVAGPTARQQRTFLLTQDPRAPKGFGADELVFSFKDPKAAADFAGKLSSNIASCPKRLLTAAVSPATAIKGTVAGTSITGSAFTITQSAASKKVVFQVAVVAAGSKVVYTMVNTDQSFNLTAEQQIAVALRAGQRATQLP